MWKKGVGWKARLSNERPGARDEAKKERRGSIRGRGFQRDGKGIEAERVCDDDSCKCRQGKLSGEESSSKSSIWQRVLGCRRAESPVLGAAPGFAGLWAMKS